MPIYEYEPVDHDCLMCEGKLEVIQGVHDPAYSICPFCGLDVRRVVSRASFKMGGELSAAKAAKQGFTTWRKAGKGEWEKVAGPGVDGIVAAPGDVAAVEAEKQAKKVVDLDES